MVISHIHSLRAFAPSTLVSFGTLCGAGILSAFVGTSTRPPLLPGPAVSAPTKTTPTAPMPTPNDSSLTPAIVLCAVCAVIATVSAVTVLSKGRSPAPWPAPPRNGIGSRRRCPIGESWGIEQEAEEGDDEEEEGEEEQQEGYEEKSDDQPQEDSQEDEEDTGDTEHEHEEEEDEADKEAAVTEGGAPPPPPNPPAAVDQSHRSPRKSKAVLLGWLVCLIVFLTALARCKGAFGPLLRHIWDGALHTFERAFPRSQYIYQHSCYRFQPPFPAPSPSPHLPMALVKTWREERAYVRETLVSLPRLPLQRLPTPPLIRPPPSSPGVYDNLYALARCIVMSQVLDGWFIDALAACVLVMVVVSSLLSFFGSSIDVHTQWNTFVQAVVKDPIIASSHGVTPSLETPLIGNTRETKIPVGEKGVFPSEDVPPPVLEATSSIPVSSSDVHPETQALIIAADTAGQVSVLSLQENAVGSVIDDDQHLPDAVDVDVAIQSHHEGIDADVPPDLKGSSVVDSERSFPSESVDNKPATIGWSDDSCLVFSSYPSDALEESPGSLEEVITHPYTFSDAIAQRDMNLSLPNDGPSPLEAKELEVSLDSFKLTHSSCVSELAAGPVEDAVTSAIPAVADWLNDLALPISTPLPDEDQDQLEDSNCRSIVDELVIIDTDTSEWTDDYVVPTCPQLEMDDEVLRFSMFWEYVEGTNIEDEVSALGQVDSVAVFGADHDFLEQGISPTPASHILPSDEAEAESKEDERDLMGHDEPLPLFGFSSQTPESVEDPAAGVVTEGPSEPAAILLDLEDGPSFVISPTGNGSVINSLQLENIDSHPPSAHAEEIAVVDNSLLVPHPLEQRTDPSDLVSDSVADPIQGTSTQAKIVRTSFADFWQPREEVEDVSVDSLDEASMLVHGKEDRVEGDLFTECFFAGPLVDDFDDDHIMALKVAAKKAAAKNAPCAPSSRGPSPPASTHSFAYPPTSLPRPSQTVDAESSGSNTSNPQPKPRSLIPRRSMASRLPWRSITYSPNQADTESKDISMDLSQLLSAVAGETIGDVTFSLMPDQDKTADWEFLEEMQKEREEKVQPQVSSFCLCRTHTLLTG